MRMAMSHSDTWHQWFAWHPVRVNNWLVWLESIERRYAPDAYCIDWLDCGGFWEYR